MRSGVCPDHNAVSQAMLKWALDPSQALEACHVQGSKSRLSQATGAAATGSLQGVFEQPDTSLKQRVAADAAAQHATTDAVPDGSRKRRRWDVAGAFAADPLAVNPQAASDKPVVQKEAAASAARRAAERVTAGLRRRTRSRSTSISSDSSGSSSSSADNRRRRRRSSSSSSRSSRSRSSSSSSSSSGGSRDRRRRYPLRRETSSPASPRRC
jgi:hypothetical protein